MFCLAYVFVIIAPPDLARAAFSVARRRAFAT